MKKLLLIAVGTSLLEKKIKSKDETKSFAPENLGKDYWENYESSGQDGGKIKEAIEILTSYNIQDELDKRNIASPYTYKYNPDRFPAEISSLLLFLNNEEKAIAINDTNIIEKNNFNYKIKLLISDTPQSKFCAKVIQGYFNEKINDLIIENDLIKIKFLNEDGSKFNQGLKNLLTEVNSLVKNGEYDEIIFNITSGFKGIIPYLTLAGMCYQNTKIIYLYETSPVIVPVPRLPVGFDIAGWNDNRAFLKTLQEVKGIYLDISQLPLSEEFKNLFEIENVKPILSSFGEFLSDEYERRKKEKSLSEFGRGYILADLIKDKDQKERLKKWINNSHFIWYGDNIPETRDHSRGHCQRLLELAAQIIKPYNIIFNNKFLLNDEELIVLTLSIWFHDIGQSGREIIIPFNDKVVKDLLQENWENYKDNFYDISDFSEIVRDIHHILGFIKLIKNPEYYHFFDNYQDGFLPKKYLKAAALSYLYHRKSTPLNKDLNYNFIHNYPDTEIKTSINEYQEVVNKLSFREKVDIEFITAIQTLVDECDNSKERTGDEEFTERRKAQTNSEILTEYKRLKYLSQGVNNYNGLLKYFKNNSGDWKDDGEILKIKASKEKIDGQSVKIIEEINKIISINNLITNPAENPILTEFIKCYEKIIFKLFQKSQFDKSGSVSSVFILPEKTNDVLKYKIVLETEYVNDNTYKPKVENIKGEQLNNACKGILFILQKVKTIFEKKGLYFEQNLFYKKEKSIIIQEINLDKFSNW
jgi:putative CRISPR-associated protein (TIGR02619 family)